MFGWLAIAILITVIGTLVCAFTYQLNYLFPLYAGIGSLTLGLLVYFNNPRSRINSSFFLIAVNVVLWTVAIFLYSQARSRGEALLWSEVAGLASAFIPLLFLYFITVFPKEDEIPSAAQTLGWLAVAVVFGLLSFTRLVIRDIRLADGRYEFIPGAGFFLFILYFVLFTGYAFYKLFRKYRISSALSKLQIKYIALGFALGIAFPVVTNLILPFLGFSALAGYGPFFTVITIAIISYAVIRHRLMSIEVVVQVSLVYTVATTVIMAFYALAVIFSETIFRNILG